MTALAIDATPAQDIALAADDRVVRAQNGDLDAFNSLVLEHECRVYAICYRLTGSREAAEDATQETFIAAWRNIGKVNPASFRPWLYRIATNTSRSLIRSALRHPQAFPENFPEPEDDDYTPEDLALMNETQAEIKSALRQLSSPLREAIVLRHGAGLDYQEIAEVMGTSLGTVKTRIFRARKRLAEALTARAFSVV